MTTPNPKAECETLMSTAITFAEQMLEEHGEFWPYGEALDLSGEIVAIAAHDGQETPASVDLIDLLKHAFVKGARERKYKATALVYDVRVPLPSTGEKSDAIAVSLNHRDNYSVVVFFAYRIDDGKYIPGEVFAQEGEADVFGK